MLDLFFKLQCMYVAGKTAKQRSTILCRIKTETVKIYYIVKDIQIDFCIIMKCSEYGKTIFILTMVS
jgi:hypothetical protein